ncbi:MAG: hypothetical protein J6I84_03405 [Bacilli bacterium]|nr:hypothetical protein [Bacilli bacterium]
MDKLLEKLENLALRGLWYCMLGMFGLYLTVWAWKPSVRVVWTDIEDEVMWTDDEEPWDGKVTLTVYNPVTSQCDEDPLVTADNSVIDLGKLKKNKLKWLAVSRDLLGEFKYGEKVRVTCPGDPTLSGVYYVHDTMNKRYRRCIDILAHPEVRTTGKYHEVTIESWDD